MTQNISYTFFSSNLDCNALMVEMKQYGFFPKKFLGIKKASLRCQNYTVSPINSSENENGEAPVLLR